MDRCKFQRLHHEGREYFPTFQKFCPTNCFRSRVQVLCLPVSASQTSLDLRHSRPRTLHSKISFDLIQLQSRKSRTDSSLRYIPAKITIVAVNAAAIVVSTSLRIVYGRRNSTADRLGRPARSLIETRLAEKCQSEDVHDDENFRYVY